MKRLITIFLLGLVLAPIPSDGKRFKTISSQEGISNNAILSMHQNNLGHLYLGTMDGLNIWNGHTMKIFTAADGKNYFYGNKVRHIAPGKDRNLFLLTTYGLARLDMISREVKFFNELAFSDIFTITEDENIFSISAHNELQYLDIETSELTTYPGTAIKSDEECHRMSMMKDGRLCIFTSRNIYLISLNYDKTPTVRKTECLDIPCKYVAPGHDGIHHFLITEDNTLSRFDRTDGSLETITDIESDILEEDQITGIIPLESHWVFGFRSGGVKTLTHGNRKLEDTDVNCSVLSLIPDKKQPIVWIGTDCNGLIRWSDATTDISCVTFDQLPYSIKMPVRSIYLDKEDNLWFGTKGDGLFRIRNFSKNTSFDTSNTERYTKSDSPILHNSVYSISESSSEMFWIGTDGCGLNYYSHKTGRIGTVKGSSVISHVHCIIEQNDSTLWVSTDGQGCYRCRFEILNNTPVITDVKEIGFIEPFNSTTAIYSMAFQNDTTLWFGSRGNGALSYDIQTEKCQIVQFPTDGGHAANETFFVTKAEDMLFATGNGVAVHSAHKDSTYMLDYVPRKAIHAILPDGDGNLWITTNSGMISLDGKFNYRTSFNRSSGIEVLEYSDGACCYDDNSNTMFFGGINGFTIVRGDAHISKDNVQYNPEIHITDFIQNNEHSHISLKMKNGRLEVPYSESIFAIEFSVVDNLNYPDYKFSYKVDGHNPEWRSNRSNIIYLPPLAPGGYTLKIKYLNQATMYESEEHCLPIYIVPPIFKRWWAKIIYALLCLLIIYHIITYTRARYASMREKLKKQYKKEILKVKNETIESITDELSLQITFMLGLCQQIRTLTSNKPEVAGKVNLVEYNIAKISKILLLFNEYKGITENSSGEATLIDVGYTANELLEIMKSGTMFRDVKVFHSIEKGIVISINKEAFFTIFNTLANKMISMCSDQKELHLKIARTESGEVEMTMSATVAEAAYEEAMTKLESQMSLSLLNSDENYENMRDFEFILCKKLVDEMNGKFHCGYDRGNGRMTIQTMLPYQNIAENNILPVISPISEDIDTLVDKRIPERPATRPHLKRICIISTNKEVTSFLDYFLSENYNIDIYPDNETALTHCKGHIPAAIMYDITSMNGRFADFMEKIKENKITGQIPVVTLTSSLQITEREECTKLGADLCISFPFNMEYLQSALEKILHKRESIAEYYKSPISSYVMNEGKFIHKDEQGFINCLFTIIEDNISNPELCAGMIAKQMGISERGIYRKIENITDKTLHQIIREARIELAAKLLVSSKLTIDEIMYKSGYDSRSSFHRNFKELKGMAPKDYRNSVKNNINQYI